MLRASRGGGRGLLNFYARIGFRSHVRSLRHMIRALQTKRMGSAPTCKIKIVEVVLIAHCTMQIAVDNIDYNLTNIRNGLSVGQWNGTWCGRKRIYKYYLALTCGTL